MANVSVFGLQSQQSYPPFGFTSVQKPVKFSLFSSNYFPWLYCAHFSVARKYNHWKVLFKDVMDSHMPFKTMIVFTLEPK